MPNNPSFADRLARIEANGATRQVPSPPSKVPRGKPGRGLPVGFFLALATVGIGLALMYHLLLRTDAELTAMGFDETQRCQFAEGTLLSGIYLESMGMTQESDC